MAATVPLTVIVNDRPVALPAIHARGTLGGQPSEFFFLDDPDNPLALKWKVGEQHLEVIRIAFPAQQIAEALETTGRADVYGIYFDPGSDVIRPESETVLKDIAAALTKHPAWKLSVEGHTDSIGTDASNLDLSKRRSAAVKEALVTRYRVTAARLTTSGHGESRPKANNATLEGRALNRRVELVRQ
jgi:outer membrane protein OmpA-like peptidoglycan-associated protein